MAGIAPSSPLSYSTLLAPGVRSSPRTSAASTPTMIGATSSHRATILDKSNSLSSSKKLRTYSMAPTDSYRAPYPPFAIGQMYTARRTSGRYGGSLSTIFPRPAAILGIPGVRYAQIGCIRSTNSGFVACDKFASNSLHPMPIPPAYRPDALSARSDFPSSRT